MARRSETPGPMAAAPGCWRNAAARRSEMDVARAEVTGGRAETARLDLASRARQHQRVGAAPEEQKQQHVDGDRTCPCDAVSARPECLPFHDAFRGAADSARECRDERPRDGQRPGTKVRGVEPWCVRIPGAPPQSSQAARRSCYVLQVLHQGMHCCRRVVVVSLRPTGKPSAVRNRTGQSSHQIPRNRQVRLPVSGDVFLLDTPYDVHASIERRVTALKMKQHPDLEAGNGHHIRNRQRILGSSAQFSDSVARLRKALVTVAVRHTEHLVVSSQAPGTSLQRASQPRSALSQCHCPESPLLQS